MSKVRMFGDEKPASPRMTIVGGRPPETSDGLPPVPTGIEQLLRLAAVDDSFRAVLLERRGDAAGAAGVDLTPNEKAILKAIPEAQIAGMSQHLPPPTPQRRAFLRQAAASAVVVLGGAALSSCDGCMQPAVTRGAQPDLPPPRPDHNDMQSDGGAAPHLPPERPNHNDMQSRGGAHPQEPPPSPNQNDMVSGGGAAPDKPPERPDEPPPRPPASPTRGIRPDVPAKQPRRDDLRIQFGATPSGFGQKSDKSEK